MSDLQKPKKNRYKRYRRTVKQATKLREVMMSKLHDGTSNMGLEEIDCTTPDVLIGLKRLCARRDNLCDENEIVLKNYGSTKWEKDKNKNFPGDRKLVGWNTNSWDMLEAAAEVECMLWERIYGHSDSSTDNWRLFAPVYVAGIMSAVVQQINELELRV